ncbi:hypothetical protein BN2476_860003 [Paraburkholderia piptadeniae]|uniref:Uncharacterized protein n=1 Tax=Paraburkholderia piptadeniae TaxID=1701573 RepID=A0A1N7STB6_9BURK|nr:hypothetical protein BN2476_860003 [Paraburkholderia piptadeniae]
MILYWDDAMKQTVHRALTQTGEAPASAPARNFFPLYC